MKQTIFFFWRWESDFKGALNNLLKVQSPPLLLAHFCLLKWASFYNLELHSEPSQTSKLVLRSVNCFPQKFHLRCLTGFWIRLCGTIESFVFQYFGYRLLLNWKLKFKQYSSYFIWNCLVKFLSHCRYLLSQNIILPPSPTQIRWREYILLW